MCPALHVLHTAVQCVTSVCWFGACLGGVCLAIVSMCCDARLRCGSWDVQVFRVTRLDDKKNQYKVVINAQENRLTGVCVITEEGINVVVVEGEKKGIRRFHRLMTHRINWNPTIDVEEADDEMFEELNKCFLVWQGKTAEGAFEDFRKQEVGGDIEGRAILAAAGVAHYWDAAQNFAADGVNV